MARARKSPSKHSRPRRTRAKSRRVGPARTKRAAAAGTRGRTAKPKRTRTAARRSVREAPRTLRLEKGDERSTRVGERRAREDLREEFPARRVHEAGLTGGETPQRDRITADDASPETLLDDEGSQTPADQRGPLAADTDLRVVDDSGIGAGGGTDEAEDARRDPIGRAEFERLRRRVARSGGDLSNFEPAESAAGSPGRARNSRRR